MMIFKGMLDCGTHRKLDTTIEDQKEIVTVLNEGFKETNDALEEINDILKGGRKETNNTLKETNETL